LAFSDFSIKHNSLFFGPGDSKSASRSVEAFSSDSECSQRKILRPAKKARVVDRRSQALHVTLEEMKQ
jgi:hypothetical protein